MMKYTKIIILLIISAMYASCSNEANFVETDENSVLKSLKFINYGDSSTDDNSAFTSEDLNYQPNLDIIIVEITWGRKSRDCEKTGICEAVWFPKNSYPGLSMDVSTDLQFDDSANEYYIELLLAEELPATIPPSELLLYVDEIISLDTFSLLGVNLAVAEGIYNFNDSLGEYGGYKIYLQ